MNTKFNSKAQTLQLLGKTLQSAKILPLVFFTAQDWKAEKEKCKQKIFDQLGSGPFIVRSSSKKEDTTISSNAGAYLSIKGVYKTDLDVAVEKVILSYGIINLEDEILIQPLLRNVIFSGVALSHDQNTCSPYRTITWHEGSDTSFVTSGKGGNTYQIFPSLEHNNYPLHIKKVINLINEVLLINDSNPIDIEYAITKDTNKQEIWLLQARPLILTGIAISEKKHYRKIEQIYDKLKILMGKHPLLAGNKTIFGVMPDWNPAEIIGLHPRPLALSLYRELITDSIWAYQRHNYGYRNLRSFPLMTHFFGLPYIDVRLSFNSFIPKSLDERIANKLVNHYIKSLESNPSLQDKIEFEIVFSCFTFSLKKKLNKLSSKKFSNNEKNEIYDKLIALTNNIIDPVNGLWKKDLQKIKILEKRRKKIKRSKLDIFEKIYWLVEDTKRYGTLPFAGLARASFIAVQILRSLVDENVLSIKDYDLLLRSIATVSSELTLDSRKLNRNEFLNKYGHLRPGTYDIRSPSYSENSDLYFNWDVNKSEIKKKNKFVLNKKKFERLEALIEENKLNTNAKDLIYFIKSTIKHRELSKFEFTKNVSYILELITQVADDLGISIEDISFSSILNFIELHVSRIDIKELLLMEIEKGKSLYNKTVSLSLPPLIHKPTDVWHFEWQEVVPNFVTQKNIIGNPVICDKKNNLEGSIVFIVNADPGYDWIFSYNILGFVTTWGGSNSHMAIRASELGIPAIIGAGEVLYNLWIKSNKLKIDCASKIVEVLS